MPFDHVALPEEEIPAPEEQGPEKQLQSTEPVPSQKVMHIPPAEAVTMTRCSSRDRPSRSA